MPSTSVKVGLAALATTATVYTFYAISTRRQQNLLQQEQNATTDKRNLTTGKEDNELAEQRTNAAIDRDRKRKMSASAERRAGEEAARNLKDARESSQWDTFSNKLLAIKTSLLSLDLSLLPDWKLPEWITKLQRELNMEPGSLANEIWTEARDPTVNPEVAWDAKVRLSAELCEDEKRFLSRRRAFTRQALAKYLEIPEDEIHEDDVPTIATTGSGGGLRYTRRSSIYNSSSILS
jgi:phospholipase A2